jgi:hypothetical protein
MMQHQTKEMMNYVISNDYKVFDLMLSHLDNKSIVEIFVKFLNEMADHNTKTLPGIDVLQQSGQSVDEISRSGGAAHQENTEKQNIKDNQKKIQQVLMVILEDKMSENNDLLTKLGGIEVLRSLLKKKVFYQTITSKMAYEVITRHLVSDCDETKRFMYELMQDLITYYETHERIEKRINIDNFEDDDINSHSGSFANDKKSKNSKKQNQEVLKDISESELFHFFKVVIQEITADEIEKRFDLIKETPQGESLRLG